MIVTQDALVEGVHFRLDWISWRDLGGARRRSTSAISPPRGGPRGPARHARRAGRRAGRRCRRALRGDRRDQGACPRRRYLEGKQHHARRHGARALGPGSGPRRGDPRRPGGRDRAARRGRCCVPARVLRAASASADRGQAARRARERGVDISDGLAVEPGACSEVRLRGGDRVEPVSLRSPSRTSASARTTSCSPRSRARTGTRSSDTARKAQESTSPSTASRTS